MLEFLNIIPCPCLRVNQTEPMAAMVVNMITKGIRTNFRGVFDIYVSTKKGTDKDTIQKRIQFTMPVSSAQFNIYNAAREESAGRFEKGRDIFRLYLLKDATQHLPPSSHSGCCQLWPVQRVLDS